MKAFNPSLDDLLLDEDDTTVRIICMVDTRASIKDVEPNRSFRLRDKDTRIIA